MRSWPSLLAAALALAACGTDAVAPQDPDDPLPPGACDETVLDYGNFGEPFIASWCRGCHSSELPVAMRQQAPAGVDFDDHAMTRQWAERILLRATGDQPTMPPAGGPSEAERALLVEWLACGAR